MPVLLVDDAPEHGPEPLHRLGEEVEVRLTEADPLTGGMIFHLMDSGAPRPGRARPTAAARKRRPAAAPKKPAKKGKRRR